MTTIRVKDGESIEGALKYFLFGALATGAMLYGISLIYGLTGRLDFVALEKDYEVYGRRDTYAWSLALEPRDEGLRRSIGNIFVSGEAAAVRTIALRRSAKQHIDIAITTPRTNAAFSADEVKKYFR